MSLILNIPELIKSLTPADCYFMDGTPWEIIQRLSEKDQSKTEKFKKYPLLALFHNIEETRDPRIAIYADIRLNLVICNHTERKFDAPDRREKNFIPVLWPLYKIFLENIRKSGYFELDFEMVPHTKTDQYFWGRNGLYGMDGNIFNDYLDAVEIRNLQLSITTKTCIKWQS